MLDVPVILFAKTLIGVILTATGIAKLSDLYKFIEIVRGYMLLPESAANFVGLILPMMEIIVGVNLLLGLLMPWPALVAAVLFLLFAAVVAINILRGRHDIACGCFGAPRKNRLTWGIVLRNIAFTFAAAAVAYFHDRVEHLTRYEVVAVILLVSGTLTMWWLCNVLLSLWRLPDPSKYYRLAGNKEEQATFPSKGVD
jgi:uncharacterized membrane protein